VKKDKELPTIQIWGLNHPEYSTKQLKTEDQPEESRAGKEKVV